MKNPVVANHRGIVALNIVKKIPPTRELAYILGSEFLIYHLLDVRMFRMPKTIRDIPPIMLTTDWKRLKLKRVVKPRMRDVIMNASTMQWPKPARRPDHIFPYVRVWDIMNIKRGPGINAPVKVMMKPKAN